MTGDKAPKKILLASPRGFCAGVVRAIDIVDLALECFGTLVQGILAYLRALGRAQVREVLTVREEVFFPLPPEASPVRETGMSALAHS